MITMKLDVYPEMNCSALKMAAVGIGGIYLSYKLYRKIFGNVIFGNGCAEEYPKDVVILHMFTKGFKIPCISPFPNKLATYFRMAKIPYKTDHKHPMGKRSKCPWVSYDGEQIDDSQLCIEYFNEKFSINLNSHLSDKEKATARAFRALIEDHYFWIYAHVAWTTYDYMCNSMPGWPVRPFGSFFANYFVPRLVCKQTYSQGIGRYTQEERLNMAREDLNALSVQIGSNKYLMGDAPCEEDCCIFGFLCILMWNPGTPLSEIFNEFENLKEYCKRMREEFWPNWDDTLSKEV